MTPLIENECTVTDSFHFAEEICKQDPNLYMASLNADSLFTKIPLDETIDIVLAVCMTVMRIPLRTPKYVFRNLPYVATKESFFMFNNKFYKQIDSVGMGSSLGPAPANIFIHSFEKKWLKDCLHGLKSVFYRQYVDDIFVMFSSLDHASKHPNINFSLEKENDGRLSFLDINIFLEKRKLEKRKLEKRRLQQIQI